MSKFKNNAVRKKDSGEGNATMGRPVLDLDFKKLILCCKFRMKQEEIALLFDMSVDTLSRRVQEKFGITFAEFQKKCKFSLRQQIFEKQMKLALKNEHAGVLMRLGEIYCDQDDLSLRTRDDELVDKTFKIGFIDDDDLSYSSEANKPSKKNSGK